MKKATIITLVFFVFMAIEPIYPSSKKINTTKEYIQKKIDLSGAYVSSKEYIKKKTNNVANNVKQKTKKYIKKKKPKWKNIKKRFQEYTR